MQIEFKTTERPPSAELARLRRVVLGQDDGFPRAEAMAMLAAMDHRTCIATSRPCS